MKEVQAKQFSFPPSKKSLCNFQTIMENRYLTLFVHPFPKRSDSYPAAKERIWKAVSIHYVDQIIQDIVEHSMELLASECCALDLWQTTRMKLSLSTPRRNRVTTTFYSEYKNTAAI